MGGWSMSKVNLTYERADFLQDILGEAILVLSFFVSKLGGNTRGQLKGSQARRRRQWASSRKAHILKLYAGHGGGRA